MTTEPPAAELIHTAAATTAVVRGTVPVDELAAFFDRSFTTLAATIAAQDVAIAGPAFARYHGRPAEHADLEVGFPTSRAIAPAEGVEAATLPAGPAATLVHHGSYDQLTAAWAQLEAWMREHDLEPAPSSWEVYLTEPSPDMDPADLRTQLVWPTTG